MPKTVKDTILVSYKVCIYFNYTFL